MIHSLCAAVRLIAGQGHPPAPRGWKMIDPIAFEAALNANNAARQLVFFAEKKTIYARL
jgi:hypothetical protein